MEILIEGKKIGAGQPAFLIAEAGVNHNGDMELAKKLVDAAVEAGADAVKFQNFIAEKLIRRNAPKAAYQDRNIGTEKSQFDMLKELELGKENAQMLKSYCEKKGTIFMSTAYEMQSLSDLETVGISIHKLASIDTVCHPLIRAIAKTRKPLILSTGLATEEEVAEAVAVFKDEAGSVDNLILLQCNTNYPARAEDQNLRAMETLHKYVPIVGFSDHTEGNEVGLAAIALGAQVIERHFTLDKTMEGPDHKASMDPEEFAAFVKATRNVEKALGTAEKKPTGGELENIVGMRRSICAAVDIPEGAVISNDMLTFKRPGDGLLPTEKNIALIIGKRAKAVIAADENITTDQVG